MEVVIRIPGQVAIVGDKWKETFRYGTNIDLEINPEVSRENEWNFMLITLITVLQIRESSGIP
jgi:hypothetical protein